MPPTVYSGPHVVTKNSLRKSVPDLHSTQQFIDQIETSDQEQVTVKLVPSLYSTVSDKFSKKSRHLYNQLATQQTPKVPSNPYADTEVHPNLTPNVKAMDRARVSQATKTSLKSEHKQLKKSFGPAQSLKQLLAHQTEVNKDQYSQIEKQDRRPTVDSAKTISFSGVDKSTTAPESVTSNVAPKITASRLQPQPRANTLSKPILKQMTRSSYLPTEVHDRFEKTPNNSDLAIDLADSASAGKRLSLKHSAQPLRKDAAASMDYYHT